MSVCDRGKRGRNGKHVNAFYHPRKDGWDFLTHFIDNTDTDKMQIHFLRNNVYILNFNETR